MKRTLSSVMAVLLCLSALLPSAMATGYSPQQTVEIIWFEDGSHAEISTTTTSPVTRTTLSADKEYTYWNSADKEVFSYILHGEFDSSTSRATKVSYLVTFSLSGWSLSSHSEYCSGSTAYGSATFKGPSGATEDVSLTLTCDKNGNVT